MPNCPNCKQPLNKGNIKKVGKHREHRKCPETNEANSLKKTNETGSLKPNEANRLDNFQELMICDGGFDCQKVKGDDFGCPYSVPHPKNDDCEVECGYKGKCVPFPTMTISGAKNMSPELKTALSEIGKAAVKMMSYRLFILQSDLDRIPRLMQRGVSELHTGIKFCPPDLPEREPEAFQGLVEIEVKE